MQRLANAVARVENLEFLSDVVPKTATYKQVRQRQATKEAAAQAGPVGRGQSTLDRHMEGAQATNGAFASDRMAEDRPHERDGPDPRLSLDNLVDRQDDTDADMEDA